MTSPTEETTALLEHVRRYTSSNPDGREVVVIIVDENGYTATEQSRSLDKILFGIQALLYSGYGYFVSRLYYVILAALGSVDPQKFRA